MDAVLEEDGYHTPYINSWPSAPLDNFPLFFNKEDTSLLEGTDLMPVMKIKADSMY